MSAPVDPIEAGTILTDLDTSICHLLSLEGSSTVVLAAGTLVLPLERLMTYSGHARAMSALYFGKVSRGSSSFQDGPDLQKAYAMGTKLLSLGSVSLCSHT